MTVFQNSPEWLHTRPDWELVRHGGVTVFLRAQVLLEAVEDIIPLGYQVAEMDAGDWGSKQSCLEQFGKALGIREYFGISLDALSDSMLDVEVPFDGGLAIVIWHFDVFFRKEPFAAEALLDIIAYTIRWNLLFGRTLILLLQSEDPSIEFPPFGAIHVMWNPREWLNVHRIGPEGPRKRYPGQGTGAVLDSSTWTDVTDGAGQLPVREI